MWCTGLYNDYSTVHLYSFVLYQVFFPEADAWTVALQDGCLTSVTLSLTFLLTDYTIFSVILNRLISQCNIWNWGKERPKSYAARCEVTYPWKFDLLLRVFCAAAPCAMDAMIERTERSSRASACRHPRSGMGETGRRQLSKIRQPSSTYMYVRLSTTVRHFIK